MGVATATRRPRRRWSGLTPREHMDSFKDSVKIFATGLLWATGVKIGEFLAARLTALTQNAPTSGFTGHHARELCPHCGRSLIRYSKTLYCARCGYRES